MSRSAARFSRNRESGEYAEVGAQEGRRSRPLFRQPSPWAPESPGPKRSGKALRVFSLYCHEIIPCKIPCRFCKSVCLGLLNSFKQISNGPGVCKILFSQRRDFEQLLFKNVERGVRCTVAILLNDLLEYRE